MFGRMSWYVINNKIRECRASSNPIECLKRLFDVTMDGMVAYALGEEYEKIGNYKNAKEYYMKAFALFPKPQYKMMAWTKVTMLDNKIGTCLDSENDNLGEMCRSGDENDKIEIIEEELEIKELLKEYLGKTPNTSKKVDSSKLFIISCTKLKIWDLRENRKFVPAKEAYIGKTFKKWVDSEQSKKCLWIVFSSRYGFIDSDHPIKNYNLHFVRDGDYAISENFLIYQIENEYFECHEVKFKIKDIPNIYFIGSKEYYSKLKEIFKKCGIELKFYDNILFK